MAQMSRRFNFDDFDEQIRDALETNDDLMENLLPMRRPGAIGSVVCAPSFEIDAVPEPPEAA